MVAATYDEALRRLLQHEGGYSNHPADPGGVTLEGVIQREYDRYRDRKGLPRQALRREMLGTSAWILERNEIYKINYWNSQRCDELAAGPDYAAFDYGVNSGIGRSKKVLQRVVGVKADGVIGPATMAAIARRKPADIVNAICDERLRFLKSLRTWSTFGKGWERRVVEVRAYALHLAEGASSSVPQVTAAAPAKAIVPLHPALKAVAQSKVAVPAAAGGVAGGGAWHWLGPHPAEAAAIAIGGVVILGAAGIAIEAWHTKKQEAPTPGIVPVPVAA